MSSSSILLEILVLKYCTQIGKTVVSVRKNDSLHSLVHHNDVTNILYDDVQRETTTLPSLSSSAPSENTTSPSVPLSKEDILNLYDIGIYMNGDRHHLHVSPSSSSPDDMITIEQYNLHNHDTVVIIVQEKALLYPSTSSTSSSSTAHNLQFPSHTPILHPVLASTLEQAKQAFDYGEVPHLAGDGLGGTYFLSGLVETSPPSSSSGSSDAVATIPVDASPLPPIHDSENEVSLSDSQLSSSSRYHLVNYVACFKPSDEEIETPANPRNRRGIQMGLPLALRGGWYGGEQYAREVAAYILDACSGSIHGVPPTTFVEGYHSSFSNIAHPDQHTLSSSSSVPLLPCVPKIGSFQIFLNDMKNIQNFGPKDFTDYEIQKIALLDLRIFNADRNLQNILHFEKFEPGNFVTLLDATKAWEAEKGTKETGGHRGGGGGGAFARRLFRVRYLTPIDHGLSLPDRINLGWADWEWLSWDQVKKPLHPRLRKAFLDTNIDDIIAIMRAILGPRLRPACYTILRIADSILRTGILAGMTLEEIGNMIARKDSSMVLPSKVEKMLLFSRKQATHEALMASYAEKQYRHQQAFHHSNAVMKKKKDTEGTKKKNGMNDRNGYANGNVLRLRKSPTLIGFSKELSSTYNGNNGIIDTTFRLETETFPTNKGEITDTDKVMADSGSVSSTHVSHPHPLQSTSIPIENHTNTTTSSIDDLTEFSNGNPSDTLTNSAPPVSVNVFDTLSSEYETIVAVAASMTATRHASVLRGRTRARLRQQNGNALLSSLGLTNLLTTNLPISSSSASSSVDPSKLPIISLCLAISADVQHQQLPNQIDLQDPTLLMPNEGRYGKDMMDTSNPNDNEISKDDSRTQTITAINHLLNELHILPNESSASVSTESQSVSPNLGSSSTVPTIADLFDIDHTEVVTTLAVSIVWHGIVTIIVGTPVGKGITLVEDTELYTVCHALIISALTTAVQKYNHSKLTNDSTVSLPDNLTGPLPPTVFGRIVQQSINHTLTSSHVIGTGAWRTSSYPSSPLLLASRPKSHPSSSKPNTNIPASPSVSAIAPTSPLLLTNTASSSSTSNDNTLTNSLVLPPRNINAPPLSSRPSLVRAPSWRHNSDLFNYDGISSPFSTGITDGSLPSTSIEGIANPNPPEPDHDPLSSSSPLTAVISSPSRNKHVPSLSRTITFSNTDSHRSSPTVTLPAITSSSSTGTTSSLSSLSPSSLSTVRKLNQPVMIPSPYRLQKTASSFTMSPSSLIHAHRDNSIPVLPSLASLRHSNTIANAPSTGVTGMIRTNSLLNKYTPASTPGTKNDGPFTTPWSTLYSVTSFASTGIANLSSPVVLPDNDQPFAVSVTADSSVSQDSIHENGSAMLHEANGVTTTPPPSDMNGMVKDTDSGEGVGYALNPDDARLRILQRQNVLREKYLLHGTNNSNHHPSVSSIVNNSLSVTTIVPTPSLSTGAEKSSPSTVLPKVHVCAVVYSEQVSLISTDASLTTLNAKDSMPTILSYAMDFARKAGSKVGEHLLSVVHKTVHPSPKHSSYDDGLLPIVVPTDDHRPHEQDEDNVLPNPSVSHAEPSVMQRNHASSSDDSEVDGVMIHGDSTTEEENVTGKMRTDPSSSLRKSLRISSDKLREGLRNSSSSSLTKLSSSSPAVCGFTFLFEVPSITSGNPSCALLRVGEWSNTHRRHHHRKDASHPVKSKVSINPTQIIDTFAKPETNPVASLPSTAAAPLTTQPVIPLSPPNSKPGLTTMPRASSYAFDLHDTDTDNVAPFSSSIIRNLSQHNNNGMVTIDSPSSFSTGQDSPLGFSSEASDVPMNGNMQHQLPSVSGTVKISLPTVHSSPLINSNMDPNGTILPARKPSASTSSAHHSFIPPSVLLGNKPTLRRQSSVLVPHTHSLLPATSPFTPNTPTVLSSVVPTENESTDDTDSEEEDTTTTTGTTYRSVTHTPSTSTTKTPSLSGMTITASSSSPSTNNGTNDTNMVKNGTNTNNTSISLRLSRLPLTHSVRHDTFNSPLDPSSIAPSSPSTVTDDSSGFPITSQFSMVSSSSSVTSSSNHNNSTSKYKSRSFREKLLLTALQQWLDDYANAYKTKKQRTETQPVLKTMN